MRCLVHLKSYSWAWARCSHGTVCQASNGISTTRNTLVASELVAAAVVEDKPWFASGHFCFTVTNVVKWGLRGHWETSRQTHWEPLISLWFSKGLAVAAKSPSFTAKPPGSRLDGLLHPGPGLESCPGQIKTCRDPVNSGHYVASLQFQCSCLLWFKDVCSILWLAHLVNTNRFMIYAMICPAKQHCSVEVCVIG